MRLRAATWGRPYNVTGVGVHIMRPRAATWGRPYPVIEKSR